MKEQIKRIVNAIFAELEQFLLVFGVVLVVTFGFFWLIDFLPEKPDTVPKTEEELEAEARSIVKYSEADTIENEAFDEAQTLAAAAAALEGEKLPGEIAEADAADSPHPVRIIIEKIDIDGTILNPESRKIADLDAALLEGAVRHPDSAGFGEDGNMFIFGHSSFLPTVHNRNFRIFNNLEKLEWGDTIRVQSENREYIYRVDTVRKVNAEEALIDLTSTEPKLTLSTCNSFGAKSDRFVVEAILLDSVSLEDKTA